MLRNKGYGQKGERLHFKGEFVRKPRISMLCFMGVTGLLDAFCVDGTFTRKVFVDCLRNFCLAPGSVVKRYPGYNSIFILDGAKIHCHRDIVYYLRSLGIQVLFLPAYCPFYNPIEILFGLIKQKLQKVYKENNKIDLKVIVGEALNEFANHPMMKLYEKCGYINGQFYPSVGIKDKM